ncbi:MAG: MaoC family dehydratase [Thermomicrobiales bacterium]
MGFGRCLEEFEPGQRFAHEPGRTITESDNQIFSLLTMNHHPLHIDAHYAASTQHGQRVAVGTLVFSVVVGMSVPDVSGRAIANLEYESVQHLAPVFIGDTLYGRTEVLEVTPSKSKPDRGVVYVETVGINQHGVEVLRFRRKLLVPRLETAPPLTPGSHPG